ncbi:MAG TPA: site-specific integrase [Edaphobacter sp.]
MPKPKSYPKLRGVFERPKDSGIWWISYQQGDVRKRERVGTRPNAIALYHVRKKELVDGKVLNPTNLRQKKVTFRELAADTEAWTLKNKPKNIRHIKSRMKSAVAEFGDRIASEIEPHEIEEWLDSKTQWANATKNRHKALLSLLYRLAIKAKKVQTNPARLVESKAENNGRVRYLLPDEEQDLMSILQDNYAKDIPAFLISLHTGMRLTEQFDLLWRQVDLENKVVRLDQTKNGEHRDVHLNKTALAAFEQLAKTPHKPSDRIWATKNIKWFQAAVEQAGIQNFTWHCLRHSFCSRLAQKGASIFQIADLAGHKDLKMTKRYSHLRPSDHRTAVEMLD